MATVIQRITSEAQSFSVISQSPYPSVDDEEPLVSGHDQPLVRRTAWPLLGAMVPHLRQGWQNYFGSFMTRLTRQSVRFFPDTLSSLLPRLSQSVLLSAFDEPDVTVRTVMWEPLLKYLKSKYLQSTPVLSEN